MCIAICIAICAKVTQGRKAATQWCLRCSEERQMLGRLLPLKRDRRLGVSVFSKHRHACLKRDSNRLSMWETLCNVQVTMHVHDACGITRRMWCPAAMCCVLCAMCNVARHVCYLCATCATLLPWVCTCSSLALSFTHTHVCMGMHMQQLGTGRFIYPVYSRHDSHTLTYQSHTLTYESHTLSYESHTLTSRLNETL